MTDIDLMADLERRPVRLPERGRATPDRASKVDRTLHQRGRTGGTVKAAGGPNILVIADDAHYCGGLARLADMQHLPISFFWSAIDVERAPFWSFDVAIIEARQWDDLQRSAGPRLAAALGHTPIVLVDSHDGVVGASRETSTLESRFPMTIVARVPKIQGPATALDQAVKALSIDTSHMPASSDLLESEAKPERRGGATMRLALIDGNRHFSNALWTAAHRRHIPLDLYADIAHYNAHVHEHFYGAVILDYDLGSLWGLDIEIALAKILGAVPAVLVTKQDPQQDDVTGAPSTKFAHLRKSTEYDQILDTALRLASHAAEHVADQ